jgi:hypothetical protein
MKTLAAAFLLLMVSPSFAQVLAIRAGTIVDPARGSSAKDQVILVEHGKILRIGPTVAIPPGAEIIDLAKEWVPPTSAVQAVTGSGTTSRVHPKISGARRS